MDYSARDDVWHAQREVGTLHAELGALWQEFLACPDSERRLGLLKTFCRCQDEWSDAVRAYRLAVHAWRDEYHRNQAAAARAFGSGFDLRP